MPGISHFQEIQGLAYRLLHPAGLNGKQRFFIYLWGFCLIYFASLVCIYLIVCASYNGENAGTSGESRYLQCSEAVPEPRWPLQDASSELEQKGKMASQGWTDPCSLPRCQLNRSYWLRLRQAWLFKRQQSTHLTLLTCFKLRMHLAARLSRDRHCAMPHCFGKAGSATLRAQKASREVLKMGNTRNTIYWVTVLQCQVSN